MTDGDIAAHLCPLTGAHGDGELPRIADTRCFYRDDFQVLDDTQAAHALVDHLLARASLSSGRAVSESGLYVTYGLRGVQDHEVHPALCRGPEVLRQPVEQSGGGQGVEEDRDIHMAAGAGRAASG